MPEPELRDILTSTKRIAVVGASNKPARASYHVIDFLRRQGFQVIPVNPNLAGTEILGRRVVATLAEAAPLDMVDIFRNSADAAEPVHEAIRLGAKTIWMQLGVINEEAAAAARAAGLRVVMDRCPAIEMPKLGLIPKQQAHRLVEAPEESDVLEFIAKARSLN